MSAPRPPERPEARPELAEEDRSARQVTRLLREVSDGRGSGGAELLPLVYDELRRLAQRRMAGERSDHTLQATALVHEAYARLIGGEEVAWADRAHFFRAAAEAMRRILLDHARARRGPMRGGGRKRVALDIANVADLAARDDPAAVLALDDAMTALDREDPDAAAVVRLRFYAGLSVQETAQALGSSARTVKRDWAFARAYLLRVLEGDGPGKDQAADHESHSQ